MQTFRDLIARWPTIADFAREIDAGYEAARKMNDRNNIHNEHWGAVIKAALKRDIEVTLDDLYKMSGHKLSGRRKKGVRASERAQARNAA